MKLTEAKLKQLIVEVLEEGMKTIADLPEGVFIKIDGEIEDLIEIYYADSNGRPIKYENESSPYGSISLDLEVQLADEFPCLHALMVAYSDASKGWGPLLYDVAIEVATMKAGGLVSDRSIVSHYAYNVWDKYNSQRSDVEKIQLDDESSTLTPNDPDDDCLQNISREYEDKVGISWDKSPLSKLYRKEPTTVNELFSSGKLLTQDFNL
jgi:hypothetical protein